VTISQGTLTGVAAGGVNAFLGVRYAMPPIGELRWRPPLPVAPSDQQISATHFGSNCPQGTSPWGKPSTAEDCLFLNIYAPAASTSLSWERGGALPVMIWLHGGGFTAGDGGAYGPARLVHDGNVIVVTINYRLGALGLFAHPALDTEHHLLGNYALMDQQLAFKWVRQNIAAFGGNPNNVTVFGESAGGIAIYAHLASPLASGLFQQAIIESGAPDYITLQQAEASGTTLANKVGCDKGTAAQIAACLRLAPVSQLLANQATPTGAIVDGQLLPQPPSIALANGQFNRVPLINGTNHDEGRLIAAFFFDLAGGPLQASGYQQALETIGQFLPGTGYPNTDIPAIMKEYPLSGYPSPDLAAAAVITDGTIACPAYEMDKLLSRYVQVWAYEFRDENAPEIVAPPVSFPYGASHFSELQYLFNMSKLALPGAPTLSPDQERLSATMIRYWTAFAGYADPNSAGDVPYWQDFNAVLRNPIQALNEPHPTAETSFSSEHKCDFWRALRARS
jgi:para-nitrobenzyl esterase